MSIIKTMNIISLHLNTVKPRLTATSLLRPLFLDAWKNGHTFSCKKPSLIRSPLNKAKFVWPVGDRINGVLR